MQSYQGAGDTLFPAFVTLIAMWVVEVPLAYFLSTADLGLGQYGIAVAVVIAACTRLLLLIPYFFIGRWMRVKVFDQPGPQAAAQPAAVSGA